MTRSRYSTVINQGGAVVYAKHNQTPWVIRTYTDRRCRSARFHLLAACTDDCSSALTGRFYCAGWVDKGWWKAPWRHPLIFRFSPELTGVRTYTHGEVGNRHLVNLNSFEY